MSESDELAAVLRTYRSHFDARSHAERLVRLGVEAHLVRQALESAHLDDVPTASALQRAVLAEERIALFRNRAGQAARERREALRQENKERSIVDIALDLGISRQAVSRTISGKDSSS